MSELQAAIFDMDGVITRTAQLHAAAWKAVFDDLLQDLAGAGNAFRPFDPVAEYRAYVDGKPREAGVRSFLRARGIELTDEERRRIAARKDQAFEAVLREHGVQIFATTLALIDVLRQRGVKVAVVSSSRHGRSILERLDLSARFDACVDGNDAASLHLRGKPEPDAFLHAAHALGVVPAHALVVEDAVAGIQAARRGGFGLVVGLDRDGGSAEALRGAGADMVMDDLSATDAEALESALGERRRTRAWRVEQVGFDPARERQMESLFTIANGYMGVRGTLDTPVSASQADMFIAGVYDRKRAELPYSEIEFLTPDRGTYPYTELVPLPFPLTTRISIEGSALDFASDYGQDLERTLDLRSGVLHCQAIYETPGGRRTKVSSRRCASLADPHLLLQEVIVTPENHWAGVSIQAPLAEAEAGDRYPHITQVEHLADGELELVRYVTFASQTQICIVARTVRADNTLRRLVSVFTSRDEEDPRGAALAHSRSLASGDFEAMVAAHAEKWRGFWRKADVGVQGRPAIEQALRFGGYHLRSASGHDERMSIGARTLSGRAYEGHVFWDAEIFMMPFLLHVDPASARRLLLYRHRTLEGARRRARDLGYRGACYAWESTVTGDDVTPSRILLKTSGKEIPIFTGKQQLHVTAGIAYAVWRYYDATGDEEFLAGPGAEILFDTARFWMSRVSPGDRHYHIHGVVGPDEYHFGVSDNAYTNWMVRHNLERAAWVAGNTGKCAAEGKEWADMAAALYCPVPDERGVIEQFEGFFALEDYPLRADERLKAPVSRLFEWDRVNRLKLIKQADVLMLPFLFPQSFSDEVVAANYDYYEPLTDHGSSLSPSVHAAIAARIGRQRDAERYWEQSLWLDLSNTMNNSTLGIHPAAMAGTWQALIFGFLGIAFDDSGVRVGPSAPERLPAGCERMDLTLEYRGVPYAVTVERARRGETR